MLIMLTPLKPSTVLFELDFSLFFLIVLHNSFTGMPLKELGGASRLFWRVTKECGGVSCCSDKLK